ncbi:MAG: exodeoxyribonuclease V subunit gamma [Pseudomonadota bacterium]
MSHLTIYTGNRLELLAGRLAEIAARPLTSPLCADIIIVQSKGMERWVRMALARINGICANISFPFPKAFLEGLYRKFIVDVSSRDPFDPDVMVFRIMSLLPERIRERGFESLKNYLEGGSDSFKLYEISQKIAGLFDQYLVFRPEMIFRWESGKESHWQAVLWRDLTSSGNPHQAMLHRRLITEIRNGSIRLQDHFDRISVFGISYLPPFYLQVFAEISRRIPVYLFLMNPCREYWSAIVSESTERRIAGHNPKQSFSSELLHFEQGNRLLSAWGVQGKSFFSLIQTFEAATVEMFQEPEKNTILSRIQHDILTLTDQSEKTPPLPASRTPVGLPDPSIQIHVCHSPMREMEVLLDNLLDLFEHEPGLKPEDIFIMAPEIEIYAPLIRSVFGGTGDGPTRIPYNIADRSIDREEKTVEGFFSILDLYNTRMEAGRILGLLGYEAIRSRFDLSEAEVSIISRWIRETRIRWGIDASDRMEKGVPGFHENTWNAGIERLILGYALPKQEDTLFAGILPYDSIEGESAGHLSQFLSFFDTVVVYFNQMKIPKNIESWTQLLNRLLDDLVDHGNTPDKGVHIIREALNKMNKDGYQAGLNLELELPTVRTCLKRYLGKISINQRFISGGMTFCTLLPMRSIPAKFIGLIGMNDMAFPRDDHPLSFDKLNEERRPGDRSKRDDDKYLFLEALLSARNRLYISYVGQSIQDNSPIPPSSLVSQLIEHVTEGFGISKEDLVVRHPLHPFSPAYFQNDPKRFSYSPEDFQAASIRFSEPSPNPFIDMPLSKTPDDIRSVSLESLCAYFGNPAAYFLKNRLGVLLPEGDPPFKDREEFLIDGLNAYELAQELIEKHLSGSDTNMVFHAWRSEGRLPHGNVGDCLFHRLNAEIRVFARSINNARGNTMPDAISGEIRINGVTIDGRIKGIFERGMVRHRYVKKRGRDLLDTWIRHLFLCVLGIKADPMNSLYLCKDGLWKFRKADQAETLMAHFMELYREGVLFPIRLFPETSFEYAWHLFQKKQSPDEAFDRAKKKFEGNEFFPGESHDPYVERCFRGLNPLDESFERHAVTVFKPLLEHLDHG